MNKGRRRFSFTAAGLAGSILLAACSSGPSHGAAGTSSPATGGTSPGSGATIPPPAPVTGSVSGPGVTADTITIAQISTTSGPVPGLFQGANDGLDAWAAYVNANGGIAGHTVKIVRSDDGFNCNTYTGAIDGYSSQVFAMVGTFTLEDTCGKSVLAAHPGFPDVQAAALDPTLYSTGNMYTPAPTPPGFQTTGYQWFKSRFPNDITHTASLVGSPAAANGREEQLTAEALGYKYVYTRLISPFETNYTSDILRMKNAGVKIVDLGAVAVTNVAGFLQQAAQQNFHPDAVISPAAYDSQLFKLVGNPALADNVMFSPLPYSLYLGTDRTAVPSVNTFLTWLDKTHPGDNATLFAVDAWASGMLLLDAMRSAGPTVTQSSVLAALGRVTTFDSDGLIAPTNPGGKQGTHCVVIAGVQHGEWVRLQPSSGFDCSGVYHAVPLSALK